jgi:pimeloyl-ACP methyl ester carboxylesterase
MRGQTRTVTAPDGRLLSFAEWGRAEGTPILSLYGTPSCRIPPPGHLEVAADLGVRLITYDRPGYGGSDRLRGRSVSDTPSDVTVIMDALGIGTFAVDGTSGGSPHALAVAALLGDRVKRAACIAPMAPFDVLGEDAWSGNQDEGFRTYALTCLSGEEGAARAVAASDERQRSRADPDDPNSEGIFERTRQGIWGWVDDWLAVAKPWGFDPVDITRPVAIVHDPEERIHPAQHAEWLHARIPHSTMTTSVPLCHRGIGDRRPDLERLYIWLSTGGL